MQQMHVAMLHFPLYLLQLVFSPLKIVTQKGSAVKPFCIAAWYVSVTKPTFFKSLYQFPDNLLKLLVLTKKTRGENFPSSRLRKSRLSRRLDLAKSDIEA